VTRILKLLDAGMIAGERTKCGSRSTHSSALNASIRLSDSSLNSNSSAYDNPGALHFIVPGIYAASRLLDVVVALGDDNEHGSVGDA